MSRHGDWTFRTTVVDDYASQYDEVEREQEWLRHGFWKALTRKLFTAPVTLASYRSKVLDIGCGAGYWSIEMTNTLAAEQVVAIDFGTTTSPDFSERAWAFDTGATIVRATILPLRQDLIILHFDYDALHWSAYPMELIYLRCACGSVTNYPRLYEKIYESLMPGTGYFENVEIDFAPESFDGNVHPGLIQWWDNLCELTRAHQRPIEINQECTRQLQRAGFDNINHEVLMIPTTTALEEFDPSARAIAAHLKGLLYKWIESIALGPYMVYQHMSERNAGQYIREIVSLFQSGDHKHFVKAHVITARRPPLVLPPVYRLATHAAEVFYKPMVPRPGQLQTRVLPRPARHGEHPEAHPWDRFVVLLAQEPTLRPTGNQVLVRPQVPNILPLRRTLRDLIMGSTDIPRPEVVGVSEGQHFSEEEAGRLRAAFPEPGLSFGEDLSAEEDPAV